MTVKIRQYISFEALIMALVYLCVCFVTMLFVDFLSGKGDLPHHLALEVGVVARALPWGHDRGVDGLLHIHF